MQAEINNFLKQIPKDKYPFEFKKVDKDTISATSNDGFRFRIYLGITDVIITIFFYKKTY